MKKKLLVLAVAVMVATAILIAVIDNSAKPKMVLEKTEAVKAAPLIIDNPKESSGKVTIYLAGEIEFEYQGPIKVWRRNGEYFVEVHTLPCSCSEDKGNVEVEVNE